MSRNTSVSLGDHFVNFIDSQVRGGRYGSASDVVRAGLRLLEEQETRVKSLQEALIAGEESGQSKPLDREGFLQRMKTKHAL
ncbi:MULTISPECIES: type II toxin-antitoxin system ParD family antitoxin [Brucella/Ochrobactrum group]|uniref:type II toxin-antitoxin system ParD family antitoxin n=1 Tax=Brucella/Ochrobactrum group TaxID=2826938 RepID=UPI000D708803|nr:MULTISPECIES: type II toxin-antitoxin system ParD family antitoxin [Brucella/Ochrobactrum group]MCH4544060.1 type II toxin-antitoxin system ParD family antitoxin [Ochrobactrum sp. A-1]QOD67027.1 type II toxin-antitoxin system ParD family antitoxin [Ochrobactrum sp. MT180101]HCH72964.1 type II toxin-antitoxin system ParD family antitoxin [Ochrobactrum sp.]KAB2784515.1 type II toxin-antitoxin system ParD family antitoxin [Brucella anthropi]PWU71173.1 type II toxin-antitoxin system ParD family